jgi:hypothetical protein
MQREDLANDLFGDLELDHNYSSAVEPEPESDSNEWEVIEVEGERWPSHRRHRSVSPRVSRPCPQRAASASSCAPVVPLPVSGAPASRPESVPRSYRRLRRVGSNTTAVAPPVASSGYAGSQDRVTASSRASAARGSADPAFSSAVRVVAAAVAKRAPAPAIRQSPSLSYYAVYHLGTQALTAARLRLGVYCCEWFELERLLPGGRLLGSGVQLLGGPRRTPSLEQAIELFVEKQRLRPRLYDRSNSPVFDQDAIRRAYDAGGRVS